MTDKTNGPELGRRKFLGAATIGAGAAMAGLSVPARALSDGHDVPQVDFPTDAKLFGWGGSEIGGVNRAEIDLFDCEVEGNLPKDLDGTFFRVGPDPQYPKPDKFAGDISFDGEGHVSAFRIRNGHVDYRTRYAKTQRWKAQHEARRSLFGMYRNPLTDDPSVKGLSRGTANTQLFVHHGKLLSYKEDSPPVYMDPVTLETKDDYYTFGGKMKSLTHTAHPKIDPMTGEYVAFGYEATGFLSKDVYVFSADKHGNVNWSAMVQAPYAGMMHDFAVTQDYVILVLTSLAANLPQMQAGGVHFAYDSTLPNYMGVMRRGGDGKDIRWFTGQPLFCTHTMGAWNDGQKVTVYMDGGEANQFPFFPNVHEPFDGQKANGLIRKFTFDMGKSDNRYQVDTVFPGVSGALSRQDDRHHMVPFRWGFINSFGPGGGGWTVMDLSTMQSRRITVPDYSLSEMTFVPRRPDAPEGDGYLIGIGSSAKESGRSDLILIDLAQIDAGPVARVKMPFKCVGQVHGFWADASAIPGADVA